MAVGKEELNNLNTFIELIVVFLLDIVELKIHCLHQSIQILLFLLYRYETEIHKLFLLQLLQLLFWKPVNSSTDIWESNRFTVIFNSEQ